MAHNDFNSISGGTSDTSMPRLKIAVWHNLPSGGGKRALYYHVRGLAERGHHVEVWCPPTADQTYLPLEPFAVQHIVPLTLKAPRNRIERTLERYAATSELLTALEQHSQQCAAEIAQGGFDLLFANTCVFTGSPFIGRFVDLPKALYLQEPNRLLYEGLHPGPDGLLALPWVAHPPRKSWLSPKVLKNGIYEMAQIQRMRVQAREEVCNARAFDAILVNSFFSRETIRRVYGLNAQVCYLGIDIALFKNLQRPREDYVIGVGSIHKGKNIPFVIEAVSHIPIPRPKLVWVGNSASPVDLDALRMLAQSLDVVFEPKVMVSDDELVELLNRAVVMACAPSLEPFGFAPLEANLCGLPVVATAEGGLRETIVEGVNGLLVESDPIAMAKAIQQIRCSPAFGARMGVHAREHVLERWSMPASIERLLARFQDVLSKSQAKQTEAIVF